jgi:hypothetical protein
MDKKRAFTRSFAALQGSRFHDMNQAEGLILMCPELQNAAPPMWHGVEFKSILHTDGGVSGASMEVEPLNYWLLHHLRANPQIGVVMLCGHYGCGLISRQKNWRSNDGTRRESPEAIEHQIVKDLRVLRSLLANAGDLECAPLVTGCLYDPEYEWLAIYDDETGLFLPSNAHAARPLRDLRPSRATMPGT